MKKLTGSACLISLVLAAAFNLPERQQLRTSDAGLTLMADFEGCQTSAYLCPAKVWTIGAGHTKGVKAGDKADNQQIARYLIDDVKPAENCVNTHLNGEAMPQSVFDAHVSLVFNAGCNGVIYNTKAKRPTYLAQAASVGDWYKSCHYLTDFKYSAGKVLKGLERRRAAEKTHCLRDLS